MPVPRIRFDTRARLEYQGLTGVANIGLSGGEPNAPPLVAGPGQPMPTIFADRSGLPGSDRDRAQHRPAGRRRAGARRAWSSRTTRAPSTARSRTWSASPQALGENAEGIDRFLAQIGQAAEKVGPRREARDARDQRRCGGARRRSAARHAHRGERRGLHPVPEQNRQAIENTLRSDGPVASLNRAAPKLDSAVGDISNIAKAIDPAKVGRTVDKVEELANAIDGQRVSRIVENTDNFTRGLGRKPSGCRAMPCKDAASLIARLNETAPKLDSAVAEIGGDRQGRRSGQDRPYGR